MRNDDARHPVVCQILNDGFDLIDHGGIERGGGLVKNNELRMHGQGSGNCDPLLLATRQGRGHVVFLAVQAHAFEQLLGLLNGFLALDLVYHHGCKNNIFQDVKVRKEIKVLIYHSHASAHSVDVGLWIEDVFPIDPYLARIGYV